MPDQTGVVSAVRQAIAESQAEVDRLSQLVDEIRARLEAERAGDLPDLATLEAARQAAQTEVERIQREIDGAKSQAKAYKREIDAWKQWYYGLPGIDKTAELAQLNREIARRAAEIAALQAKIASGEDAKLAAMGHGEIAGERIAALEAGVYGLPLDADPRLVSVLAARDAAVAALAAAKGASPYTLSPPGSTREPAASA